MEFGIFILMQQRGYHQTSAEVLNAAVEQTVLADQAGFDAAWYAEHHFSNYNTYGDPFLLASYLAPQLPEGTVFALSCAVPPLWNPMRSGANAMLLPGARFSTVTLTWTGAA